MSDDHKIAITLFQLLLHVERTSPECLLFPGDTGLCEPVPVGESVSVGMSPSGYDEKERRGEEQLLYMLEHQQRTEQVYIKEALALPRFVWRLASSQMVMGQEKRLPLWECV